jgi:soluble cytochrome b562
VGPHIPALVEFIYTKLSQICARKGEKQMSNILRSLNDAFRHMQLKEEDEPAMNLARLYAQKLDSRSIDDKTMKEIGAEFNKVLIELLMTPKSRKALTAKEVAPDDDPNSAAAILAELQA